MKELLRSINTNELYQALFKSGWTADDIENIGEDVIESICRVVETAMIEKIGVQDQTDAKLIANIKAGINDYYAALDRREHGGVAMSNAFNKIQEILGMLWKQGAT